MRTSFTCYEDDDVSCVEHSVWLYTSWNFFNLRVIGHLLANEIVSDKLKDAATAGIAIACEYFCDKTVDSRK